MSTSAPKSEPTKTEAAESDKSDKSTSKSSKALEGREAALQDERELEQFDRDQTKLTNETRARLKQEFEDSDQGAVTRQNKQAAKDMRGPSPTPGNIVPKDPSVFPPS